MNLTKVCGILATMIFVVVASEKLEAASMAKSITNTGSSDKGSALQKKLEAIGNNEIVYLDMRFKAAAIANDTRCSEGWFGPLPHSDRQEFQIKPVENNNNLLLSIIPGSKIRFPYNAVSCAYDGSSPTKALMRFRGYYVAVQFSIPTALLIEFRPVTISPDAKNLSEN